MKIILFIFLLSVFTLCDCSAPDSQNKPQEGLGSISTDNYANKELTYYYYIPLSIKNKVESFPLMILIPGLGEGYRGIFDDKVKEFAEQEQFAVICPQFKFDEDNFATQTSYQFPQSWSGKALLEIVDDFNNKGVSTDKLYLFGFSAGAQVSARFPLLYNYETAAVFAHASGGIISINRKLPTIYFVTVGSKDEERRKKNAKLLASSLKNYGNSVTYKEYPIGHQLSEEVYKDMFDFFKKVKNSKKKETHK